VGADDVFCAEDDDGEGEDPTAATQQGIHHVRNDAPVLSEARVKGTQRRSILWLSFGEGREVP
jgi:hypothetical protein